MKVGEFIRTVNVPKEIEGWGDLNVEERYQRDINYKRVKEHIAPYLANDPDRFVGSFIVTAMNDENMVFESLEDANINIPAMMGDLKSKVGNIILSGEEILVPLDGQHRLAAFKFATTGKDNADKDIPNVQGNFQLAEDTVSLIIIRDDNEKSRKIFNKVNRYAKPTSKADNLITADDDIVAVLNREIVINELLGARVVKMDTGNTLSDRAGFFTTIATTYEVCLRVLEERVATKVNTQVLPNEADQNLYRRYIKEFWEEFITIDAYASSLQDPAESGDERRAEIRKEQIHCKPIMVRALARAILRLTASSEENGQQNINTGEVINRINNLDWNPDHELWQGIIIRAGKIMAGTTAEQLAARYIAYLLGERLEDYEKESLESRYKDETDGRSLPEPVYS
tara:strand:+ start:24 stop:1220 length:1197 start_codon:yes stop_codon:yes gene_type:complete